jgi:hypothetical protein
MLILLCARFRGEGYHAPSAVQLNFALRPNNLIGRDLAWWFQDDWRNQAWVLKKSGLLKIDSISVTRMYADWASRRL